jgi:putative FmdB family regulatory protein
MLYDYKCDNCEFFMEDVYQSIKEDALKKCPECKQETLNRIIYGGTYASVKYRPQTVGQLAEARWEEGHRYMPDGSPISRTEWNKCDMVERAEKRRHEKAAARKENEAKRNLVKKINNMTPEQKRNYIINGD